MNAYSGYNEIHMHPMDEDKTTFMVETPYYCYKVMSFILNNVDMTYQCFMNRIPQPVIRRNVQVYKDDMVLTSKTKESNHLNLEELFTTINKYQLKLNLEKCVFRVKVGKFLDTHL